MQTNLLLKRNRTLFFLMLMLLTWGGIGQAMAEVQGSGTKEDPYVLEDGTTITLKQYTSFYAKFTAPADGIFTLSTSDKYSVYKDGTFSEIDESVEVIFNSDWTAKAYFFECEAGVTYYLGDSFLMNDCIATAKFRTETEQLILKEVTPAEGSVFNAGEGIVGLSFNQKVQVASVMLEAGTGKETLTPYVRDAYITIDVKNILNRMYNNGNLKAGDEIKFTLKGVAPTMEPTKLYEGTGEIVVTYVASNKPLQLIGSTGTPISSPAVSTFKSYYMADDPAGIVTLEFSGEVNMSEGNKPIVTLNYGTTETEEQGEYYLEELDVKTQGDNTIMFCLKDKLRRPKDMVASGIDYGTMTISVANVRDMEGNYCYAEGSGVLGSFTLVYTYSEVKYTVDTDWTLLDANGALIGGDEKPIDAATKSVELWMREAGGKAAFSGAEFRYTENGTEKTKAMTLDEITIENEEDETVITIPVPAITADAGSNITVALTGVQRPDGLTETTDPTAFDYVTKTFSTTGLSTNSIKETSVDNTGNAKVSAYSTNGIQLLNNADTSATDRLSKGIYIINGKKVIIR